MTQSIAAQRPNRAGLRALATLALTFAVLLGVTAQQQSVAAPAGLGAKIEISDIEPAQSSGLLPVHHKGYKYKSYGHKGHHFKHGHGFKRHGFKRHGFKKFRGHGFKKFHGHRRGFKKFGFKGHRGFKKFGFKRHRRW